MAEMTTVQPQAQAPAPAPAPAPAQGKPPLKKKGAQKKKMAKRLIALAVAAAICLGGGFALHRFLNSGSGDLGEIYAQPASIGSIQSTVSGSGTAKAKESAAITLTQSGTVQEVLVAGGDTVTAGQPLYTIYSQAAEDEVNNARKTLTDLQKDMADLQKDVSNLTVRAPFSGKLMDVKDFQTDQDVSKGTPVATIVNDKKLKLTLYFSYAYENSVKKGQAVTVSVPAVMGDFSGYVDDIHKVSYISPEGAVHFEAVIAFDNPGTLTAGMDAAAVLTAADGSKIYPYQNGKTEYYESRTIECKANGPVTAIGNLRNYANVSAGEAILTLGSSTLDTDIRAKQEQLDEAQKKLDEAAKALANFHATAPIDGTVTSCSLVEGEDVKSGDTVIIISNNTTMLVDITVDAFLPEEYIPDAGQLCKPDLERCYLSGPGHLHRHGQGGERPGHDQLSRGAHGGQPGRQPDRGGLSAVLLRHQPVGQLYPGAHQCGEIRQRSGRQPPVCGLCPAGRAPRRRA